MTEQDSRGARKDPAEAADNPAEALAKDAAEFVPDGTGGLNETDGQVEVHASISEGMNAENKTSGTTSAASSKADGGKP